MLVYVREAHAMDSRLPMAFGAIEDPISDAERQGMARFSSKELGLSIPAVVDRMDDAVGKAYHGWPERLYLIGADGKVSYRGGPGPFGFDPEGWEDAIRAELAGELEAYRHLRIAARSYARTALPTLSENLDRGREAYQGGAIPIGELLSIQRALVEARVTYVDLLFEASLAAFRIEAQAGGPVP